VKRVGPLLALIVVAAAGCSQAGPSTAEPTPVRTTTGVVPSATPRATTPSTPSEGTSFRFKNVRLVIPDELESRATGEIVPFREDFPWFRNPEHVRISLTYAAKADLAGAPQRPDEPASQIAIYRVAELRDADSRDSPAKLQAYLSHPDQSVDDRQLPLVPWFNAAPLIGARVEPLQFETGEGMRFVTEYTQEAAPVTNGGLIYQFQGLTSDKRFYVIGLLPLRSRVLADDYDAPVPEGGVPFPGLDSVRQLNDYWARITQVLDAGHSADFSPGLDTLDSLIESIEVG
jgi:hypothetical protein